MVYNCFVNMSLGELILLSRKRCDDKIIVNITNYNFIHKREVHQPEFIL